MSKPTKTGFRSTWRKRLTGAVAVATAVLVGGGSARATTEIPAFDARSVAMGGNGVAYIDNANAVYMNPAALGLIPKFSVQLTGSPLMPRLRGPAGELTTEGNHTYMKTKEQEPAVAPLYYVGGAFRVHDRLVLGVGNWINAGFGGKFTDFGGKTLRDTLGLTDPIDLEAQVAAGEAAVALSYQASDQIFFGASYRITYAMMDLDLVDTTTLQRLALKEFTGAAFTGFQLGMLLLPTDDVRVGATYRSETHIDLEGDLTTEPLLPGMGGPDTRKGGTTYATPHQFRLGVSWQMHPQLMWTLGSHYLTYANRWSELEITDKDGVVGMPTTLKWKDVWAGATGMEVRPMAKIPFDLRVGAQMTRSATNPNYPNVFFMPPGKLWGVSGGVGYRIADWVNLDGAVVYNWAKSEGRNILEDAGIVEYAQPPDEYGYKGIIASLSVTVQH